MNTEEKRLLTEFLDQLKGIHGIQKDEEAQRLIKEASDAQPDALYLLVQKSLLQDQALNGAKAQIASLQRELAERFGIQIAEISRIINWQRWTHLV